MWVEHHTHPKGFTVQDPDRWCSHAACGQEAWQIISQWVWNLRLELGHQLEPEPMRTTEFAPALPPTSKHTAPPSGYAPAAVALPFKQGRFSGRDFVLQPDGTLRCPASQVLSATEARREADGSLRLVYAARLSHCRGCRLREQCQWQGRATVKPRRVSVLLHPLEVGSAPLLWKDWSRRQHRRACIQLLHHQRVDVQLEPPRKPRLAAASFSCEACPLPALVGRTGGAQHSCPNSRTPHDQAVRRPPSLCYLARPDAGVEETRSSGV